MDELRKLVLEELPKILLSWVVTGPLVFISGVLFGRIMAFFLRSKPHRALLGLKHSKRLTIVIGTPLGIMPESHQLNRSEGMPIFGYGPLFAYHYLANLIAQAYSKQGEVPVAIARTFPRDQYKNRDMILLGFPEGNEVTRDVMDEYELPLLFRGHDLVDSATDNVRYRAKIENGKVVEDYGCIIRVPNPDSPDSVIFILAGCETYGVKAAAEFLDPKNLPLLWDCAQFLPGRVLPFLVPFIPRRWKSEYYQVIVKVRVREHSVSVPKFEKHYSLTKVAAKALKFSANPEVNSFREETSKASAALPSPNTDGESTKSKPPANTQR